MSEFNWKEIVWGFLCTRSFVLKHNFNDYFAENIKNNIITVYKNQIKVTKLSY